MEEGLRGSGLVADDGGAGAVAVEEQEGIGVGGQLDLDRDGGGASARPRQAVKEEKKVERRPARRPRHSTAGEVAGGCRNQPATARRPRRVLGPSVSI